jgi:hypothetical protein
MERERERRGGTVDRQRGDRHDGQTGTAQDGHASGTKTKPPVKIKIRKPCTPS